MFEIKGNPQLNKESFTFTEEAQYPYFTRTILNNGIAGYVKYLDEAHKIKGNCLAVGMMAMKFFYMNKDFYAGQFTKRAIPKFELTPRLAIYFTCLLNKFKNNFLSVLVRDFEKTFLETKISLPINAKKEIDYAFIESFIAEIETQQLKKLKAYLQITGFNDYNLTEEEEKVIKQLEVGKVSFKKFIIEQMFKKIKVNSLKYKTSSLPNKAQNEYILPALTAGIQNQGLNNYVPKKEATILKNVISISANGANTGATFYQSKEFTVLQDAYAIQWKYNNNQLTDQQYLYLTSAICKTIYGNYDWSNKAGWERIKREIIQLPITKDDTIDFLFMETLIKALQKLVIKEVVLYAEKKIQATQETIK